MITAPIVWLPESEVVDNNVPLIVTGKKLQEFNTHDGGIRSGYAVLPHARNVFESLANQQLLLTLRDGPALVAKAWAEALKMVRS